MKKESSSQEYKKFDDTMTQLLKVSHREIREKLEEEKKRKGEKPVPTKSGR